MASDANNAARLGATISERRVEIERRWLEGVLADVSGAPGVTVTELRDGIPHYLAELVTLLSGTSPKTFEQSAREAWSRVASEHGVTRVRIGFDIGQLVREFVVLRHVIRDVATEHGIDMTGPSAILADALDAAISAAVQAYVEARDDEAQRKQAEHIGFLTHELRNPLATATLTVSQLRRRIPGEHGPLLERLERSHRRLTDLIDKVLLAEKLQAGKVESRPVEVKLGQVMEGALEAAHMLADHKGIEFRVSYDPSLALYIDALLTRSAIQNLADNATKYTDSGHVEITVEVVRDDFLVHVRDTCGGISSDELRTIFEPFERGNARASGTGLGLSIAKDAVEAQGGSIHVESHGEGCHFWVALPKFVTGPHDANSGDLEHGAHPSGE